MGKDVRGDRFLADFNRLKLLTGNDPSNLDISRGLSDEIQALCKDIAWNVRSFERVERSSLLAFTDHIAPRSISARREYDDLWKRAVQLVADKDLMAYISSLLDDVPGTSAQAADDSIGNGSDELSAAIADWKQNAVERSSWLNQIIEFAAGRLDQDESGDFEWVRDGLDAWDTLTTSGLHVSDVFWRRCAVPHILIPTHVAKHYGKERASLYSRLKDAGIAFAFGAPLAALAMQRAVMEEVLTKHWGARKSKNGYRIEDANLPELSWDSRADRLKRLANDALHNEPDFMSSDELDRLIVQNFQLLRLLIENAPENH